MSEMNLRDATDGMTEEELKLFNAAVEAMDAAYAAISTGVEDDAIAACSLAVEADDAWNATQSFPCSDSIDMMEEEFIAKFGHNFRD